MSVKNAFVSLAIALLSLYLPTGLAYAQSTAFTYQGRLNDGATPANGNYDLRFAIYDSVSGGTRQGALLTNSATAVTNGLFTVILDFGNQFPSANRWLEIAVQTNGGDSLAVLTPRQQLTAVPYALQAANATAVAATNINGTIPLAQLPATVVTNGASDVNFNGIFTGNGVGLTNLNFSATTTSYFLGMAVTNSAEIIALTNGLFFANGKWNQTNREKVIQAAIDSLPFYASKFAASGGSIILQPGIYETTDTIIYTNNYIGNLKLVGAGMSATIIKANGAYDLLRVDSIFTNDSNIYFKMSDLMLANATVCTNNLLYLAHWGRAQIDSCAFADWYNLTNNYYSTFPLGMQLPIGLAGRPTGLVGLWMPPCQGDGIEIRSCEFIGLGNGIVDFTDHSRYYDNGFAAIGIFTPDLFHGSVRTNTWPINNIHSIAAGVYFGSSAQNDHWLHNNHFYWTVAPILADSQQVKCYDTVWEGCDSDAMSFSGGNVYFLGSWQNAGSGNFTITNNGAGGSYGINKSTAYTAENNTYMGLDPDGGFTFSVYNSQSMYAGAPNVSLGGSSPFAFSGDGSGLTSLNAGNIVGQLNDAQIPTNAALLNINQTFSGTNTFSKAIVSSFNGGTNSNTSIGQRWRDNTIVAWAQVNADGTSFDKYGVNSITNNSQGVYSITLNDSHATGNALIPVVSPKLNNSPTTAITARIAAVNQILPNQFQVFINNGNWSPTNNDFVFIVTGR